MKSKTPSFITEIPLKTTSSDESTILTRYEAGRQLLNACIGECLRRLNLMRQSKEFQRVKALPKKTKERTEGFKALNTKFQFTEYDIHHYATGIRDSWINEHIGIHIAQKLATRAFKAVQKKAFGTAKNVRFKGKNQLDSLEGKNNQTGLIFKPDRNILEWAGLELPCILNKDNKVIAYGLDPKHKLKYCRIVRRKINSKNRFYLQLILEGTPYQNPDRKIGTENIGLDVGVGTIAMVGDTRAEIIQFCDELVPKQKEKRKLQRKLDRSRRAMNPDNFNENGTAKKGYTKWNKSNHFIQTSNDIAKTDRKLAAYRKSLHGKDINHLISLGTRIQTEKVSYRAWQRNFGKTISVRAPSMFMSSLKRKAENAGGYLKEFPTQTTKLSQTCHICGEAVKKPLSQRWHECCGIRMQRDLYSAFLSKCVDVETNTLDLAMARMLWQGLEPVLNETISRVNQTASGRIFPPSFGFNRIQSQSSSSVNPISNATKNLDVVIRISEDKSQIGVA